MEIGPFSWGGNEEQMWRGSWGADSCRDRGLGLHEGTCDCGYRNCLKPQSWGSVWAWEAKLPPLTLDFLISRSLMEPVEQEACGERERGRGRAGQDPRCRGCSPYSVCSQDSASQLRAVPLCPTFPQEGAQKSCPTKDTNSLGLAGEP